MMDKNKLLRALLTAKKPKPSIENVGDFSSLKSSDKVERKHETIPENKAEEQPLSPAMEAKTLQAFDEPDLDEECITEDMDLGVTVLQPQYASKSSQTTKSSIRKLKKKHRHKLSRLTALKTEPGMEMADPLEMSTQSCDSNIDPLENKDDVVMLCDHV